MPESSLPPEPFKASPPSHRADQITGGSSLAANRQQFGGKAGSDSAPIPVAAEPHLVRSCQLLRQAVEEACRLIWVEDAVWTKDGPAKLDKWVETYGPLVGFKTDGSD